MNKNSPQFDFGNLLFDSKRTILHVAEIAEKLGVTEQHVTDLIEGRELRAVNVGVGKRKFWRIPANEYEKFLKKRASNA